MKVDLEVINRLPQFTAQEIRRAEVAVTQGVAQTARQVQTAWRGQVTQALGRRMSGTIRMQMFPGSGTSPNAAALVFSRAPDIVGAHDKGALIASASGFWLAIPTPAAGRGAGGRRLTPGEWEARRGIRLRFVFRPGKPALLVADTARLNTRGLAAASRSKTGRGVTTVPIFVLVPQVRLPKRMDLKGAALAAGSGLSGAIRAAYAAGGRR